MLPVPDPAAEWLEADGLGGFACGTVGGLRTRRYHGLLVSATTPPTGRMMLVNGFDAWLETPAGPAWLTAQRYAPDVTTTASDRILEAFTIEPWPTWTWRLAGGIRVCQELFVPQGRAAVALRWRLLEPRAGVKLALRPLLSGRDYHALHHENTSFRFKPVSEADCLIFQPYPDVPAVVSLANGAYGHEPCWYRRFQYDEERARGQDFLEDLGAPGVLRFDLERGPACWLLAAGEAAARELTGDALGTFTRWAESEHARRASFATPLHRAADAYFVRRGTGRSLVAGYPWFTDWGRDTFIALRGLGVASGRLEEARDILLAWSASVSQGMLPNRFTDRGEAPEYNAVDASLLFIIAAAELLATPGAQVSRGDQRRLHDAMQAILTGYADGTRYGIRATEDGLLAAGQPGVQLTWMDSKIGDWVVTPRCGKPVEVQAFWLNALYAARDLSPRWGRLYEQGRASFAARFWCAERGYLYDVIDGDHVPGRDDATLRPNQIFAVGGLPLALLDETQARQVVETVERQLLTPLGLRSLARDDSRYRGCYAGGSVERDSAYHQGTVWPWLLGPFVEAWLRVQGDTAANRRVARERFVAPLRNHLAVAGLGHVSEVADGDAPHTPGGCPFQAWSVGELLRLEEQVLAAKRGAAAGAAGAAGAKRARTLREVEACP